MANLQNPVKAIRAHCLDCCGGQTEEVKYCPITGCALYPFRLGRNPYRTRAKRELTDEQKTKMLEALAAGREAKKKAEQNLA